MNKRPLRILALALLAAFMVSCRAFDEGRKQPIRPQRPTVSSNTGTPQPDHLTLEAGVSVAPGDAFDSPTKLRYGLDQKTEAYIGWSPYVWLDTPAGDFGSVGDIFLGYKHRFLEQAGGRRPSLAYDLSIKLPTADEDDGIGTGEFDVFLAGIADWQDGNWGSTGYARLGLLGVEDESWELDGQYTLAMQASYLIDQTDYEWTAFGELSGIWVPERDRDEGFLILGAYLPWMIGRIFDVSVALGLGNDSPDYTLLFGFTSGLGVMGARLAQE